MPEPSTPEASNLRREAQASSSRRPCSRMRARRPAYTISAARETTAALRAKRCPTTRAVPLDS
jgi:hypothetical protein